MGEWQNLRAHQKNPLWRGHFFKFRRSQLHCRKSSENRFGCVFGCTRIIAHGPAPCASALAALSHHPPRNDAARPIWRSPCRVRTVDAPHVPHHGASPTGATMVIEIAVSSGPSGIRRALVSLVPTKYHPGDWQPTAEVRPGRVSLRTWVRAALRQSVPSPAASRPLSKSDRRPS